MNAIKVFVSQNPTHLKNQEFFYDGGWQKGMPFPSPLITIYTILLICIYPFTKLLRCKGRTNPAE